MSSESFFGNMSYLATMPSCKLYLKAMGSVGNTSFFDLSPNKYTITNIGGVAVSSGASPQKYPPGSINTSSSSKYLSASSLSGIDIATKKSVISTWFNFSTFPAAHSVILGGYTDDNNWWGFHLLSGYTLTWYIQVSGSYKEVLTPAGTSPGANIWHHAAAIGSGSTRTIYLDGSSVGTVSINTGQTIPSALQINSAFQASSGYHTYIGYSDEIGVWSGDVVPTISQLYNSRRRMIVG